uniref:Fibronectin type-III domain-containing protein n=1 Tax=Oreochromis aureus TaxID=47969 RepID=A0A668T5P8_OREAU
MTALIWMLSWLPLILPAVGILPKPVNVSLTSLNFSYILKWQAGPGTPPGVYYNVEYTTDRKHSWNPVAGCERVQKPLVCNLTAAFSVLTERYLTRVGAQLGGQVFGEPVIFTPIEHLSLPLLSVAPSDRSLSVDLHPPLERLRKSYDILHYELQISSSNLDKPEVIKMRSLKSYKWDRLEPGRRHLLSRLMFISKLAVFLRADPLISGILCSFVIIIVFCIFLLIVTGFICLRRRLLPSVLTTIHHLEEAGLHDPYIISPLNVEQTAPSAGKKGSSCSSSDESDDEGETESMSASTGGAYTQRAGTNLLSSSSSSSSSLTQPKPPPLPSSNQEPYSQRDALISTGSPSRAGLELRMGCGGRPEEEEEKDVNLFTLTFSRVEQEEEEEEKDVNLLTLTFGRVEQEEEEEKKSDFIVEEVAFDSVLAEEGATETVHDEEEEEEEVCGYMGRSGI